MPAPAARPERHHYFLAIGLILGGGIAVFLFLGLIGWIVEHFYQLGPTPIDAPVLQAMEDRRSDAFTNIMLQITALGSVTVLTLLVVLVFLAMVLSHHYRTALSVVVASVGVGVMSTGVKNWVDRPRPPAVKVVAAGLDQFVGEKRSFPSGHAMGAMAVYLMLGFLLAPLTPNLRCARFVLAAAVGLPLLIGLSRLYLGVHYPTDVLTGWIAGAMWAFVTLWTFRVLDPGGEWLAKGATKPGA